MSRRRYKEDARAEREVDPYYCPQKRGPKKIVAARVQVLLHEMHVELLSVGLFRKMAPTQSALIRLCIESQLGGLE